MPAYAALIVGVLLGGMVLYQIADAANLSARAQSAADAAALAGAKQLKSQIQGLVITTGLNEAIPVDPEPVCDEAEAYAHANDAELTACEVEVDPALEDSEVFVEVISRDEVDEESGLSDQVRTRLTRQARAAFEVSFAGGPDGAAPGHPSRRRAEMGRAAFPRTSSRRSPTTSRGSTRSPTSRRCAATTATGSRRRPRSAG